MEQNQTTEDIFLTEIASEKTTLKRKQLCETIQGYIDEYSFLGNEEQN